MADKKISALTGATTPLAGTEVLPIVQSGSTVKVAVSDLTSGRAVDTGLLTATKTQNATSTHGFINSDTTNTSSRTSVNFTAGNRTLNILTINADNSYVNTNAGNLYLGGGGTIGCTLASTGIVTMPAYGAGAATFSAAGVISSVSDETWKIKDGIPENPDEMLKKLEPGYWFYNNEKKDTFGADRQLGFYAQNVHAAIGEEAAPTPEKYKDQDGNDTDVSKPWGYYDRSVLAITVMSLKNALATIEELKVRLTALENK
jgi:hypothetical protein